MPDYPKAIRRAARRYGLNPRIFLAQIKAESNLNPHAVSDSDAHGIAQFIPSTARQYGVNLNDGKVSDDIDGAARYMRDNLRATGGDYRAALSLYNSGRPDAYKNPNFAHGQTTAYVQKIMAAAGGGDDPSATSTRHPGRRPGQIVTSAGQDRSSERADLLRQFVQDRGKPGARLALIQGIAGAQDTLGRSKYVPGETVADGAPGGAPKEHGVAKFDGHEVAAWIKPALAYARKHGWQGSVQSGYRSRAEQTRIYNSGVRPAAKPGTSNHEGTQYPRGAVDVSDPAGLWNVLKHTHYSKQLRWAGSKDPVHFSHPHNGSY